MTRTRILKPLGQRLSKSDLKICRDALEKGGVIAFPTDTVYGLGCSAFNLAGIQKIYTLKGRDYKKPLPILLADVRQLEFVAKEIPKEAHRLIEVFWPGSLTLVFKTASLGLAASRGKETIAVRIPDHGVVRQLLDEIGLPLAATSANRSGQASLNQGGAVVKRFQGKVDVIVDGGECEVGRESSVVDATQFPFSILREGAIPRTRLAQALNLG